MKHKGATPQHWDLTLLNLKPQINPTKLQKSIMAPYNPHAAAGEPIEKATL